MSTTPLLGGVLDPATASVIGLPRAGGRGLEWHYGRAGLPYSLASELSHTANRTTLASYTERLIDQRGRPPLAQSWLVGPALPALPARQGWLVGALFYALCAPLGVPT